MLKDILRVADAILKIIKNYLFSPISLYITKHHKKYLQQYDLYERKIHPFRGFYARFILTR